jgi:hypothetical protein
MVDLQEVAGPVQDVIECDKNGAEPLLLGLPYLAISRSCCSFMHVVGCTGIISVPLPMVGHCNNYNQKRVRLICGIALHHQHALVLVVL